MLKYGYVPLAGPLLDFGNLDYDLRTSIPARCYTDPYSFNLFVTLAENDSLNNVNDLMKLENFKQIGINDCDNSGMSSLERFMERTNPDWKIDYQNRPEGTCPMFILVTGSHGKSLKRLQDKKSRVDVIYIDVLLLLDLKLMKPKKFEKLKILKGGNIIDEVYYPIFVKKDLGTEIQNMTRGKK